MSAYQYKGVTYTIETRKIGKRWGWTTTVGDITADSGPAYNEHEAAAFAEAKLEAEIMINELQRNGS